MAQTSAAKNAAQNKSANGIDPRRQAALDTALAQVEKLWQGIGHETWLPPGTGCRGHSYWILGFGYGIRHRRPAEPDRYIYGPESSGNTNMVLDVVANAQKAVAWPHSSMPSMRSIRSMPVSWASTPIR